MLEAYWGKCIKEEGMANCVKYCRVSSKRRTKNLPLDLRTLTLLSTLTKVFFVEWLRQNPGKPWKARNQRLQIQKSWSSLTPERNKVGRRVCQEKKMCKMEVYENETLTI